MLTQFVRDIPLGTQTDLLLSIDDPADAPLVYAEVLDFLITRPTPQEIVDFKISAAAQTRLRALLDKNREETLTDTEAAELDLYEQLDHLMILLKAKAYTSDK